MSLWVPDKIIESSSLRDILYSLGNGKSPVGNLDLATEEKKPDENNYNHTFHLEIICQFQMNYFH